MNKAEVKQIILEEIYSALKEIKNSKSLNENYDPKKMASIIRKDIGQGDEEDNKIIDPILKKYASKIENASPNKVGDLLNDLEKELNKELEDITNTASSYISAYKDKKSTNKNESLNELSSDDRAIELAVSAFLDEDLYQEIDDPTAKDPEARAVRKYDLNVNKVARFSPNFASMEASDQKRAIAEFMIKVINIASSRQGKGAPKKFFEKQDLINVVKLLQKGEFSSQDLVDAVSYFTRPQQANKLLAAWREKGWVIFPETKPSVTRLRPDRPRLNLGDLDLDEHIKNYVYSYLKESASPFNNKLKEIEATGKIAALEAKLNAVEEMVNAANERLSRIDEDEEFSEMMDKGKVNSMRSEVKQLEKTREKLQKEYAKTKNGKKSTKEPVMDEDKDIDLEENFYSKLNEEIGSKEKEYLLKAVESILDGDYGEPLKKGQSKIYSNVADKNDLEEEIPSLLNIGSNFITFEDDKNGTYKVRNNKNGGIEIKVTAKVDVANLEENFLPTKLNESILRMQKLAGL